MKAERPWLSYVITGSIGLLIALLVLLRYEVFTTTLDQLTLIGYLSDACFTSGVLILGSGLLVLISGEGIFDGLGYAMQSLFRSLTFKKDVKSYSDYRATKAAKRKNRGRAACTALLVVGGIFFAAAGIFTTIYMTTGVN